MTKRSYLKNYRLLRSTTQGSKQNFCKYLKNVLNLDSSKGCSTVNICGCLEIKVNWKSMIKKLTRTRDGQEQKTREEYKNTKPRLEKN